MKLLFSIVILVLLLIGGYNFLQRSQSASLPSLQNNKPTQSAAIGEVVAKNLDVPWDMTFLPDGSMLVTERAGRVRLITPEGKLQEEPIAVLKNVLQTGESGLQGITLHPNFSNNHYLYLYYTYAGDQGNTLNRVSRFTYTEGKLHDEKVIVDEIPGAIYHDGGRIRFGPDKYLYITTGDAHEPSRAQTRDSLAGKILRVTDTGKEAQGNPFGTRIYSYGHRNPQGITWDNQGRLYATEHGRSNMRSGLDELNMILPGKNYGWPIIQGDDKREGMVTPLINSGPNTTWAPSGATFLDGSIYFAGLRGQSLYKATVNSSHVELTQYFTNQFGRLRNVIVGPDNLLYISTSNRDGRGDPDSTDDKIIKVNPLTLEK